MDKKILQRIIDENLESAEMGCSRAQGQIVQAQAELDRIAENDRLEWWAMLNRQQEEQNDHESHWVSGTYETGRPPGQSPKSLRPSRLRLCNEKNLRKSLTPSHLRRKKRRDEPFPPRLGKKVEKKFRRFSLVLSNLWLRKVFAKIFLAISSDSVIMGTIDNQERL